MEMNRIDDDIVLPQIMRWRYRLKVSLKHLIQNGVTSLKIRTQLLSIISVLVCTHTLPAFAECESSYKPVKSVAPTYPRRAVNRGIEGYATVKFTVGANGEIKNPRISESKPKRTFDRAAILALKKFVFQPCRIDNQAVDVDDVNFRFNFSLNSKSSTAESSS